MNFIKTKGPGLLLAVGLSFLAALLGQLFPIVGGPVFGIVLGILIGNVWGRPQCTSAGLGFAAKTLLQWAIIALGGGLSLTQVYTVGSASFLQSAKGRLLDGTGEVCNYRRLVGHRIEFRFEKVGENRS
jgi:uncharacterized membrane protein YadS